VFIHRGSFNAQSTVTNIVHHGKRDARLPDIDGINAGSIVLIVKRVYVKQGVFRDLRPRHLVCGSESSRSPRLPAPARNLSNIRRTQVGYRSFIVLLKVPIQIKILKCLVPQRDPGAHTEIALSCPVPRACLVPSNLERHERRRKLPRLVLLQLLASLSLKPELWPLVSMLSCVIPV
jgi:hypothetical protein